MSTNKHIDEVIDNWATWLADADNKQDGFITDHTNSMALSIGTDKHEWQPNRYWNGAAWVYYDVTYDDITANGILYAAEYIHHLGDTGADTYLRFEEDKITLACGGVDMVELIEDTADYVKINTNLGIGTVPNYFVHAQKDQNASTIIVLQNTNNHTNSYVQVAAVSNGVNELNLFVGSTLNTALDGFAAGTLGAGKGILFSRNVNGFLINNYVNTPLYLATNNVVRTTWTAAGLTGFGIQTPDTLVHIWSATAGTVAAATDALLCIENSGDAFISLLGGTANDVGIIAGDSGDNDIGSIKYSHAANTWTIVAGAANILTIASIYAKFNVDVFLPDSIYLKFGDTIADPRAYLFAETIVGPGDTLHINSDSMILLESGAGVIVTIQSSSVTFGGPADVDVLFYKGAATPAFTFDHGLGQFHAEDNCPSSWGNTAAAPDGKIYSDGTNLRVNGLPPSSGTNVNDWYVDNMGYVRVKLS